MSDPWRDLGPSSVVFFGFSANILGNLRALPDGCIVVYEEPDVVRKRDLHELAKRFPMVSSVVEWEYQRTEELDRLLHDGDRLKGLVGVVPGVEYGVEAAAGTAAELGLPGAGVEAGRAFRDKYELRQAAARVGLRNPRHRLADGPHDVRSFLEEVAAPCVVKPTSRQASLGVQIVSDPDEADAAWELATGVDEGRVVPDRGIPSRVVVEEAVVGDEYSVETLVSAGRTCFANVTAKLVLPGRFPVEMGHVVPAPVPAPVSAALVRVTERLAEATGFGDGILHAEWIVAGDEPTLVECAARMPGDELPRLLAAAYDFPLVEHYLRVLLGEAPPSPSQPAGGSAIRFLTAPPGTVVEVSGVEDAQAVDGVVDVKVTVAPGATVHPVQSSWDRVGYVMTAAATPVTAGAAAELAAGMVTVTVEP